MITPWLKRTHPVPPDPLTETLLVRVPREAGLTLATEAARRVRAYGVGSALTEGSVDLVAFVDVCERSTALKTTL